MPQEIGDQGGLPSIKLTLTKHDSDCMGCSLGILKITPKKVLGCISWGE